jgi:hypothetical protein
MTRTTPLARAFGDVSTSPLYTLKTVLNVTGGTHSEPGAILGALPLIGGNLLSDPDMREIKEFWRHDRRLPSRTFVHCLGTCELLRSGGASCPARISVYAVSIASAATMVKLARSARHLYRAGEIGCPHYEVEEVQNKPPQPPRSISNNRRRQHSAGRCAAPHRRR